LFTSICGENPQGKKCRVDLHFMVDNFFISSAGDALWSLGNDEITLSCVSVTVLAANDEDKICRRVCTIKIRFSQWALSIFGETR
jgi:hypothetical protein